MFWKVDEDNKISKKDLNEFIIIKVNISSFINDSFSKKIWNKIIAVKYIRNPTKTKNKCI